MSKLHQPSRIRVRVGISDLEKKHRNFLSKTKQNYERAIKEEIATGHYVVENNSEGLFFVKKLKERFDHNVIIYAETPMDYEDLPEEIREVKLWQKNLAKKDLKLEI